MRPITMKSPKGPTFDLGVALSEVMVDKTCVSKMFKALVEKSNDIIVIADQELIIRYITGSVEQLLGVSPEWLVGRHIKQFVEMTTIESLQRILKNEEQREDRFSEVSLNTVEGEKKYFDVTVSNLLDNEEVNGLVVNLHDVTSRKLTEEKLVKANNELDQFIYKTSHDLRAPLLTAIGLVELAEKDPEKDRYDYLKMIRKSLIKLDNFIEDINAFYRNEKLAIQHKEIDFHKIIKEEFENLRGLHENFEQIDLNYQVTQVSKCISDEIRMKTVVTNLLSNAIKYCDLTKPTSFVFIDVQVTPDTCVIRVEDNGIGIRSEYLKDIFNIFYRADDNAKGSGLGLYIVKDTVDKLNGQIEVESDYGKGSVFTISIPNFLNAN